MIKIVTENSCETANSILCFYISNKKKYHFNILELNYVDCLRFKIKAKNKNKNKNKRRKVKWAFTYEVTFRARKTAPLAAFITSVLDFLFSLRLFKFLCLDTWVLGGSFGVWISEPETLAFVGTPISLSYPSSFYLFFLFAFLFFIFGF